MLDQDDISELLITATFGGKGTEEVFYKTMKSFGRVDCQCYQCTVVGGLDFVACYAVVVLLFVD